MDPSPEKNRAACYQGPMKLVRGIWVKQSKTSHTSRKSRRASNSTLSKVDRPWALKFTGRSKKLKGLTATYILFEVKKLSTFHWSLPKLCMQYFSTVSVVACVVFEEQWNKQLSSGSSLHVQFWCHAIFNCHTVTMLDHDQVL